MDGGFVQQSPIVHILKGQYLKIPTIQGHNDDEGSLFATGVVSNSDNDTKTYITSHFFAAFYVLTNSFIPFL